MVEIKHYGKIEFGGRNIKIAMTRPIQLKPDYLVIPFTSADFENADGAFYRLKRPRESTNIVQIVGKDTRVLDRVKKGCGYRLEFIPNYGTYCHQVDDKSERSFLSVYGYMTVWIAGATPLDIATKVSPPYAGEETEMKYERMNPVLSFEFKSLFGVLSNPRVMEDVVKNDFGLDENDPEFMKKLTKRLNLNVNPVIRIDERFEGKGR